MSLYNLCFSAYRRNLTSPLPHWHRGTAFHIDTTKNHPDMQVVHAELGADMVALTVAARITQSIFILVRNLLYRRQMGWKILPEAWKNKAFQTVLWMCWNVLDILLAVEVTSVYVYKNTCKHSVHCHTKQTMNSISIYCHQACEAEPNKMPLEEELPCPKMEPFQQNTAMDEENSDMDWNCDYKVFSDMDILVSKETLLPSCTNPIILSMICVPSEDCESSLSSEESILSEESECEEESEEDSSQEDTSVDSGMQESWTPKSKEDLVESEEESDWSDEEDDSWDEEGEADCSKDDELWASFCRNDDPYNPLSFAMPTRSPTQQGAQVKKDMLAASCEEQIRAKSSCNAAEQQDCQETKCTMGPRARKPIVTSFKSSHKCVSKKDESIFSEDLSDHNTPVKKVRFSSNVVVHNMITWSFAYRAARKGPWEEFARDSCRFRKRISETEAAIGFCLEPHHREKIWAFRHCEEN